MDNLGQLYNPQGAMPASTALSTNLGYGGAQRGGTPPFWAGGPTAAPAYGSRPAPMPMPPAPAAQPPTGNPYTRTGAQIAADQIASTTGGAMSTAGPMMPVPASPVGSSVAPAAPGSVVAPKGGGTATPPIWGGSSSPMKPVAFGTNRAPQKAMFR